MTHELNYEELPIDIHYNKLADWLINRRHCQQNWPASSLVVRDKINEALKTLPDVKEVADIMKSSKINYFHVKEIMVLLSKDSESGKKNILGQYSNELTKAWSDISNLYEKNNLYLAESAQIISRNVNYEIPDLKRQIARCQQIEKDCLKKESDSTTKVADYKHKYQTSCKKFGIKGDKIKSELFKLVDELPQLLEELVVAVKSLNPIVEYYQNFVKFLVERNTMCEDSMFMVKFIITKGNCSVYEWRTGEKPVSIINDNQLNREDQDNKSAVDDDIDWGNIEEESTDINYDNIDFDMSQITVESSETNQKNDGIDWGDGVETTNEKTAKVSESGVARGEDALSVLEAQETRNLLMEDLMELKFFLNQRLNELQEPLNTVSMTQFENASQNILLTPEEISSMINLVKTAWNTFSSERAKHLLKIKRSPKFVERLEEGLRQNLVLADKMVFQEKEMARKRQEALREEDALQPKLDVLRKETKELKNMIETEISKKYKNRVVNIMGEINVI
ncbi:CDK5 regulatory subunit-associated protein 3-like [Argonauta hians]